MDGLASLGEPQLVVSERRPCNKAPHVEVQTVVGHDYKLDSNRQLIEVYRQLTEINRQLIETNMRVIATNMRLIATNMRLIDK